MNVQYLGTRLNKRQARGAVTGKRYSYSANGKVFSIDPADKLQFQGDMEDGKPKFKIEESVVDEYADFTDSMSLETIANLSIDNLRGHIQRHPEMTPDDLMELLGFELAGQNRVGATKIIKARIDAATNE